MFDKAFVQNLKRTNVSMDNDKTRQRVEELWKASSSLDKKTILELADIARSTVYRIYNTGVISVKLAISIAQTLNVSPFYLTGESDEKSYCTEDLLKEFLVKHSYEELLAETSPSDKKRQRRNKTSKVAEDTAFIIEAEEYKHAEAANPAVIDKSSDEIYSEQTRAFARNMNEDEMVLLLRSIMLKAKSGMENAMELAEKIQLLLLS